MDGHLPRNTLRRRLAVAGVILVGWILASNEIGISVALPEIDRDLGLGHSQQLAVVAAYLLPLAALSVLAGRLGDVTSLTTALWGGGVVFVAGSLVGATFGSFLPLILARLGQGTGAALMLPAATAVIATTYAPDRLGRALSRVGVIGGTAVLLSPALLGVVVTSLGWRWVFVFDALVIPLAVALAALRHGRAVPAEAGNRWSVSAGQSVTFVAALTVLTAALLLAPEIGLLSPRLLAAFAASFGLFALLPRIGKGRDSILAVAGLGSRTDWTGMLVIGHGRYLSAWLGTIVPIYLQVVSGLSASGSGVALIPLAIAGLVGQGIGGPLADRFPWRTLTFGGLTISAVGFALAAPVFRAGDFWWALVPLIPASIGSAVAIVVGRRTMLGSAASSAPAAVSGTISTVRSVMGLLGLVMLGGIAGHFAAAAGAPGSAPFLEVSMEAGLLVAATVMGLIAVAVLTLPRPTSSGTP